MYNLSRFCCQNPKCPDHGKRGAGNLSANKPYGKGKMQRLLYCRTCKRRFSARKGTVFFGCRLADKEVVQILDHLADGCGVRKTARLTGRSRNTVARYSELAGQQAKAVQDELAAFSPTDARSAGG